MKQFTLICLLLSVVLFSRADFKYAPGYIITPDNDTVYGSVRITVDQDDQLLPADIQNRMIFVSRTGTRTTYLPGSISYFHFFYNFQNITYASVPFFNGQLFMQKISEKGYVNLYRYFHGNRNGISNTYELAEYAYQTDFPDNNFFYLVKPTGEFLFLGKHTPRGRVSSFFSDDPQLKRKIESRRYTYTDVYRMVREYNRFREEQ